MKLVKTESDSICKIFPINFYGCARAWYHSLKPDFILGINDLYVKLISHFDSNIPIKKSVIEIFVVT